MEVVEHVTDVPLFLRGVADLLRPGGLLVTSNLFLGRYDAALPGLAKGAEVRRALFDPERWLTTFAELKALSIRL
jgi:2-polyprenyl-3-methyl-5-hydroxy-6-metoxy-1,4-benzoquinol methylase